MPLTPEPVTEVERAFAENQALDPDRPEPISRHVGTLVSTAVEAVRAGVFGRSGT